MYKIISSVIIVHDTVKDTNGFQFFCYVNLYTVKDVPDGHNGMFVLHTNIYSEENMSE